MAMRIWSAALCALGAGLVLFGATGDADARGVGGGGFAGSRGGGGFVGGRGVGGRPGAIGGGWHGRAHGFRHGHRHWGQGQRHDRFGHRSRFGGTYGGLPYSYGGYGPGGYDSGPGRSASQPNVGIPPSAVLPPAIYVIGDKSGRGAGRQGTVVRKGSGGVVADSRDVAGGSSVVVTSRDPDRRHRAR